ncbi:MAG: energy transducer TonB [Winogradskyella sp.]
MKLLKLCITILIFGNLVNAQEHPEFYNRPFVIFEGCENATDKVKCYDINLHELIGKHLNTAIFKDSIFIKAKKDTITVSTSILYDEKGVIVKSYSNIYNSLNVGSKKLKSFLDRIPKVKPVLDDYDNGVASTVRNQFGFFLDRTKDSIIPILGYEPSEVPFSMIENVPVYKGCDKSLSNTDLKDCMSNKVKDLVSKNFNIKLAKKLDLPKGVARIFVAFKIDKKGKVIAIRARGPHKVLENEAIRVIKKIPKLKKPGFQRGKPVIVPYALPIVFRITD